MAIWHVYLLECGDGTLYTGITNDIESRIEKHRQGKGSKYVMAKGFKKLRYKEDFKTKSKALRRESEIKRFSRSKKLKLIEKNKKPLFDYADITLR